MVTNTTFRLCPWANVLYALDAGWWRQYQPEVQRTFRGECVTPQVVDGTRREMAWLDSSRTNSGAAALAQAAWWGARRVILLGYDCQHTAGRTHWHGSHPEGLGDAAGVADWPAQFEVVQQRLHGVEVINASRETALALFLRMPLEAALALPEPTTTGVPMKRFAKPFRGVPNGEIYPIQYKPGDECPRELESAARQCGVLVDEPIVPAPVVRRGRKAKG